MFNYLLLFRFFVGNKLFLLSVVARTSAPVIFLPQGKHILAEEMIGVFYQYKGFPKCCRERIRHHS